MTATTIGLDDLAPLPTDYSMLAKPDRKRYNRKHDEEALDYKFAVITFIPRQRVTLRKRAENEEEATTEPKTVAPQSATEKRLRTLLKEAKTLLSAEMKVNVSNEKSMSKEEKQAMPAEEKRLRDGLSQSWRLLRDTLAPEKQRPRIMMVKVRDVFRTKKKAVAALNTYYKPLDPHYDHQWIQIGHWDGFMDEDNALNVKMVNKDMYNSSHDIFQQVMSGLFESIGNDRKGLEFRMWKDSTKTDMWRRLSRIKHTSGHEAPEETMRAIQEGKTLAQVDKEDERQSLSSTRLLDDGKPLDMQADAVQSSDNLFAQLASLAQHKKKTMASFRRRHKV